MEPKFESHWNDLIRLPQDENNLNYDYNTILSNSHKSKLGHVQGYFALKPEAKIDL